MTQLSISPSDLKVPQVSILRTEIARTRASFGLVPKYADVVVDLKRPLPLDGRGL